MLKTAFMGAVLVSADDAIENLLRKGDKFL